MHLQNKYVFIYNALAHIQKIRNILGGEKYLFFSQFEAQVPENWENSDEYLHINGLEVTPVRGDGFCILNAISTSFLMDLMKIITVSKMKQKITDYLIQNEKEVHSMVQWHTGQLGI